MYRRGGSYQTGGKCPVEIYIAVPLAHIDALIDFGAAGGQLGSLRGRSTVDLRRIKPGQQKNGGQQQDKYRLFHHRIPLYGDFLIVRNFRTKIEKAAARGGSFRF